MANKVCRVTGRPIISTLIISEAFLEEKCTIKPNVSHFCLIIANSKAVNYKVELSGDSTESVTSHVLSAGQRWTWWRGGRMPASES